MNKGSEPKTKRLGVQHYLTQIGSLNIEVLDYMAEHQRLEEYGVALLNRTSAVLRHVVGDSLTQPSGQSLADSTPIGPEFEYTTSRPIFGGRTGSGPLYVAWDTNLLIDYFTFGSIMWKGDEYPDGINEDLQSELECLEMIIALWVIRDIRFVLVKEVIDDAKQKLSKERTDQRINALLEFASAVQLVSSVDSGENRISREGLLVLPGHIYDTALDELPQGLDRRMVAAAHSRGVHVFLTRDKRILRSQEALRPLGLLLASPGDLLEYLIGAGAYNCILGPGLAYWPLPDQQRVAHLIRALPDYDL